MDYLKSEEVESGLKDSGRVYLCGNLKRENGMRHIPTDSYEIGISDYPEYTFEKAHYHAFNREYNYVLEGEIKVFLLYEKKEYHFRKGDLFILNVNEPYVGKSAAGTRTIFSKVPGGDDKVLVPMDEALLKWGESWETVYKEETE